MADSLTGNEQALVAHSLLTAKRGDGMLADPVARFHLGNGATVHAAAGVSGNGMAQFNGAMMRW